VGNAIEIHVYQGVLPILLLSPGAFLLLRPANPLRQMLLLKLEAYRVVFRISEVGEPLDHAHHKQGVVFAGR
jgi:hypothetical protein